MKVAWFVAPSEEGGFPNIGQYRFYKKMPIRASIIYPYLAAMGVTQLVDEGFDVDFLDCPTMDISWGDTELDALYDADIIVMEARTPILKNVFGMADAFREESDDISAKVVLYGDHVTWDYNTALQHADFVVAGGDFDYGITKLACALRDKEYAAPFFNAGLVKHLDDLPFVDRNLVPWEPYYESWRNRKTFLWTMSGRGCTYKCTFCAWTKTFWNNTLRLRSPIDVAHEFWDAYDQYGECEILDDNDLFHTGWGVKFANILLKDNIRDEIQWACQTHPNMIHNLDDCRTMRKAKLRTVKLGVESGNQESLNKMGKCTTVAQIERAVDLLQQADIAVHANLMVGWPWETKAQAYHTIEWIKKLKPNQAQFSLIIPYPNTELYDQAKSQGWLLVGEKEWEKYTAEQPMMIMDGMTPEEIVKLYKDSWSKFYFDKAYIMRHLKEVIKHPSSIKQMYSGFKSIYYGHMRAVDDK